MPISWLNCDLAKGIIFLPSSLLAPQLSSVWLVSPEGLRLFESSPWPSPGSMVSPITSPLPLPKKSHEEQGLGVGCRSVMCYIPQSRTSWEWWTLIFSSTLFFPHIGWVPGSVEEALGNRNSYFGGLVDSQRCIGSGCLGETDEGSTSLLSKCTSSHSIKVLHEMTRILESSVVYL